jgi:amino acid adenylation domain-containing protein
MKTNNEVLHLLNEANGKGISVFLEKDNIKLKVAKNRTVDPDFLTLLKQKKTEIITFLKEEADNAALINSGPEVITPFQREELKRIPLSFAQERLWFIDKLEGSVHYHIPTILRFKGELDEQDLRSAFQKIMERHETLRTIFKDEQGEPYQEIRSAEDWQMDVVRNFAMSEPALEALIKWETQKFFDLSRDYMLRVNLIQTKKDEYVLVIVVHHIASDGWSEGIFVDELVECYLAAKEKRPLSLPDLPIQYADYAVWQRKILAGERMNSKLEYWRSKLEGSPPLQLPTDFKRPAVQSNKGQSLYFKIDKQRSRSLQEICQAEQVTPFMLLLAVFKILLYKYSGQNDITVGTPIANREQKEIEPLIGFFVNTLVLRSFIDGTGSFREFLQELRSVTLEAYSHQEVPFEKLVEEIVHERKLDRSPLFQVMFVLQNSPESKGGELADLQLTEETFDEQVAKFDQTWTVVETDLGWTIELNYSKTLFKPATIERMVGHFQVILEAIIADPGQAIDKIPVITPAEEKQLVEQIKNQQQTTSAYVETTLVDLFAQQVIHAPDHTAVVFKDHVLTYRELDERSEEVARWIIGQGIGKVPVAICLEYSFEMIIGIMGILKAGCAYVPITPEYPKDRIQFMLDDVAPPIILTVRSHQNIFADQERRLLYLDEPIPEAANSRRTGEAVQPNDLAYIIYTSGSSGKPKGVQVEHHSIANELRFFARVFDFNTSDRHLLLANFVFDGSVEQLFLSLVSGATLVMVTRNVILDPNLLAKAIDEYGITHMQGTPSLIQSIEARKYARLKRVCAGGEKCLTALARSWSPYVSFFNKYGTTETTVNSSYHPYDPSGEYQEVLPVGKAIDHTSLYILDAHRRPVPAGVVGELYIGGVGVSRGYLNRPALTEEKFINSPFTPGERLYKTGDLARWLNDGNIEFKGRKDQQVKIRGYRIELGEIEAALMDSEFVEASTVIVHTDSKGEQRLVAYIVPEGPFVKPAIEAYLSAKLPEYLHPSLLLELPALPLTTNGKVNKKALPQPQAIHFKGENFVAPRNDLERKIAKVWAEFLALDEISVYDDFFRIGGHSLLAMRVISALQAATRLDINVGDLFRNSTIASLAQSMEDLPASTMGPIAAIAEGSEESHLMRVSIDDDF